MTNETAASDRLARYTDRLLWGLADLRDRLLANGWWPARRFVAADGAGQYWTVRGWGAKALPRARRIRAVIVDADDCLWGQLRLPALSQRALAAAVSEALIGQSPLPPQHMYCAWRTQPTADGGWLVDWGLVARQRLAELRRAHSLGDHAPAYLRRPDGTVCMVRDSAYAPWQRWQRACDGVGLLCTVLLIASAAALAFMQAALQRQGVVAAMQQIQSLQPQAQPIRQSLDELRAYARVLEALRAGESSSTPAGAIIEALAATLPDDTMLDRIDISGHDIRITGLTPNATDLLSRLSGQGVFADVRATAAAVRDGASRKERFTFELRWKGGTAA